MKLSIRFIIFRRSGDSKQKALLPLGFDARVFFYTEIMLCREMMEFEGVLVKHETFGYYFVQSHEILLRVCVMIDSVTIRSDFSFIFQIPGMCQTD